MGTDLHIYAEELLEGKWRPVPEPRIGPRAGDVSPVEALDIGRPYELFSLLAGANIGLMSRLTEMPRLFTTRGFPSDLCDAYAKAFATYYESFPEGGDAGASWLALRELEELDWEQPVRRFAFVEPRYVGFFQADGPYPQALPEEARLYHDLFMKPPSSTRKVYWTVSLREYVGCSEWFINSLHALAPGSELRIIYWFNS